MRKKILLGLGAILVVVIVATVAARMGELGQLRQLQISDVDLASVADGVYVGSFGQQVLSTTLQVTVEQGRITDISILEPSQGLGKHGQRMIEAVLTAQTLEVDVVTGATATSKLVLRTVEEALRQGLR